MQNKNLTINQKDKIKGFLFDRDGNVQKEQPKQPEVIMKGMKKETDEEDGWFDERGNFHINQKDE
mgnify:CR=1 FL=1